MILVIKGDLPKTVFLIWNIFQIFVVLVWEQPRMKKKSDAQKELLKWHWKLGIGMCCIQEMMREQHYEDPDGRTTILPAIIQPKNSSARNCIVPPCQSCLFACAKKRSPKASRTQPLEDIEGAITRL
jgi:hypothetical protein